ncbi:MAG: M1 family peptidase, partial [Bacteroidota bacterium]
LTGFTPYRINTRNPSVENPIAMAERDATPAIGSIRNAEEIEQTYDEQDETLRDFYTEYDPLEQTVLDQQEYEQYLSGLSDEERAVLEADKFYYQLDFANEGGLVMPIVIQFTMEDGTSEDRRIPAEIWRRNYTEVSKVFVFDQAVTSVEIDPYLELADVDRSDNFYPTRQSDTRFDLYQRRGRRGGENPMQRDRRAREIESGGSN